MKWLRAVWLRIKRWFVAVLVALGLIASPLLLAETKDVSWDHPVTRADGSVFDPATELAETRIYCDGDVSPTIVVPGPANTVTHDFSVGSHTCYATAVDVNGQESDPSVSTTFEVLPARPSPPTGLTVN